MSQIDKEAVPINLQVFEADDHGGTFGDILREARNELSAGLKVMNGAEAQRRMEYSELDHERPAIAGLIKELERVDLIRQCLAHRDTRADRLKMALGTAARIVMQGRGWRKTGRKTAVGVGEFFSKAERYER